MTQIQIINQISHFPHQKTSLKIIIIQECHKTVENIHYKTICHQTSQHCNKKKQVYCNNQDQKVSHPRPCRSKTVNVPLIRSPSRITSRNRLQQIEYLSSLNIAMKSTHMSTFKRPPNQHITPSMAAPSQISTNFQTTKQLFFPMGHASMLTTYNQQFITRPSTSTMSRSQTWHRHNYFQDHPHTLLHWTIIQHDDLHNHLLQDHIISSSDHTGKRRLQHKKLTSHLNGFQSLRWHYQTSSSV